MLVLGEAVLTGRAAGRAAGVAQGATDPNGMLVPPQSIWAASDLR